MPPLNRSTRRWLALLVWGAGLVLFFGLGWWNLSSYRRDAENRLIGEAGRAAAQLATLFSLAGGDVDEISARAIVAGAMEDENLYAVKVETEQGVIEGQRRNYLWEPIPWDDEIAENCVQGINPIKIGGSPVGVVDIWLSSRLSGEDDAQLARREYWRFFLAATLWTFALVLVFWQWGDFRRLGTVLRQKEPQAEDLMEKSGTVPESDAEKGCNESAHQPVPSDATVPEGGQVVDPALGRRFQRRHPESWMVTAGMFRQTFARGPALLSRLYSEGETAGLCHLGRILEQAAPCIGAERLAVAAKAMQNALNDPECEERAKPVEDCAKALDEVLDALCGNGQWRSRQNAARS